MKNFLSNGALILLVIAVLYILFLRECKKPPPCPAEDEIVVKKSDWQSMIDAANKPSTVHIDTFYIKEDPITDPGTPVVDIPDIDPDSIIFSYEDSLIKNDIDVKYSFVTEGRLLSKEWSYRPIQTVIHRIDSIPYPVPVDRPYEVLVSQKGLYAYGAVGGNANSFIFGGGLDYITKKNTELGYIYQRFGSDGFHSFKLGIKLFNKK